LAQPTYTFAFFTGLPFNIVLLKAGSFGKEKFTLFNSSSGTLPKSIDNYFFFDKVTARSLNYFYYHTSDINATCPAPKAGRSSVVGPSRMNIGGRVTLHRTVRYSANTAHPFHTINYVPCL